MSVVGYALVALAAVLVALTGFTDHAVALVCVAGVVIFIYDITDPQTPGGRHGSRR